MHNVKATRYIELFISLHRSLYWWYMASLRCRLQSGSVDGGLGGIIGNGPLGYVW